MPVLILIVLVIVVGVAIVVRSGTWTARGSTAAQAQDGQDVQGAFASLGGGATPGLWCLASGLVAAVGVAMIGQATFGWAPGFDPPGWLRVMTFWMLPAGVGAAAILGALALKQNSGRMPGIAGLVLAVLSAVAFVVMLVSVDY